MVEEFVLVVVIMLWGGGGSVGWRCSGDGVGW